MTHRRSGRGTCAGLSYRDVEELLTERGIVVDHIAGHVSTASPMSSTRSGPLSRPARSRAKPTPRRLATLAPTSSRAAEPRVSSSRVASWAAWARRPGG